MTVNWTVISTIASCTSAIAACVAAWLTANNTKQQVKIDLYNERYNKIYKTILEEMDRQTIRLANYNNITKESEDENKKQLEQFGQNLDYSKFLIKTKDFERILELYKEYYSTLVKTFNKYIPKPGEEFIPSNDFLRDKQNLNRKLDNYKKKFLTIITPYLQVENNSLVDKIKMWRAK